MSRASLINASIREVLFSKNLTLPFGLAIDYLRRKLYWADEGIGRIEYSPLSISRQGRTILVLKLNFKPFQIAVVGDQLVWTTEGSTKCSIADLFDSQNLLFLQVIEPFTSDVQLFGLAVMSENLRPEPGEGLRVIRLSPCMNAG